MMRYVRARMRLIAEGCTSTIPSTGSVGTCDTGAVFFAVGGRDQKKAIQEVDG